MKQVVGIPFTGVLPRDTEIGVIDDLLSASHQQRDGQGLPVSDQQALLEITLEPPLKKLRAFIESRVKVYL
jgi:hypothetical protein